MLMVGGSAGLPGGVADRLSSRGWLESPWIGVVLSVLVLLAVALLVRVIRRRRGMLRTSVAVAAVVGVAVLAGGAFANAYAGYVPDTLAAERLVGIDAAPTSADHPDQGTVGRYHLGAPALGVGSSAVWVYLPPGYGAAGNAERYPVVYLLHGFPGRSADWFAAGRVDETMNLLIATGAIPPAIVVAPDMNGGGVAIRDTEGLDAVHGPQIQTYLASTVPGWADHTFRTIPGYATRIIGGMSAGGYAALNIGLRHQDVFGGIIAQEPYGEPGLSVLPLLGGDRAAYAEQSPSSYLPSMSFTHPVPTFIDDGAAAPAADPRHLAALLRRRGQPVEFRLESGQRHTWTEARVGVAYGLVWTIDQLHWSTIRNDPHRVGVVSPVDTTAARRPRRPASSRYP